MPGFTTHYLFGVHTLKRGSSFAFPSDIKNNKAAFGLGLQGPDVSFYYLPGYAIYGTNIGSVVHTTSTNLFLKNLLKSRKLFTAPDELSIAKAYICGFFGHYLLDTTCHPYIYGRSKNTPDNPASFSRHVYLECDIDVALLARYKKMLPGAFHQEKTIALSQTEHRIIARMLHYCFTLTYPKLHVSYATALGATFSMPLGCKLFYGGTSNRKKALFRRAERIFPGYAVVSPLIESNTLCFFADPLNERQRTWQNPWDASKVSNASFPTLFSDAMKKYEVCLDYLNSLFDLPYSSVEAAFSADILDFVGNLSYHSGLTL